MANEKNWHYRQNVNIDGADDTETGQNWMFQFYTFLSGGADDTGHAGAWEIVSASNGSSVVNAWTGSGDVVFDDDPAAHSWFVARSSTILPVTGAGGPRYLYLTVDCQNSDPTLALFRFDYNIPQFPGTTTAAPAENVANQAYEKNDFSYRYEYDAGNVSYFHGIMNETGSFVIWSARNYAGQQNYPSSLCALRLETPRKSDVDPYPVWLRASYSTSLTNPNHGTWDCTDGTYALVSLGSQGYERWPNAGGNAMWDENGSADITYGLYSTVLTYSTPGGANKGPQFDMDSEGSDIDGTYPRLPVFVCNNYDNSNTEVRGRVPDITTSVYGSLTGLVTPQTGTITACQVGDFFFPATASLLPGV